MLRNGSSLSGRERNRCFLNTGGTRFANISSISGLDYPDDARAVGLVDWDGDGDLDMWLVNRTGPQARLMRNNTDGQGRYVSFRLRSDKVNRDGIGARVQLTAEGIDGIQTRTLHAGDGFASQTSKWLHFGLGDAGKITSVRVWWPDGQWEEFSGAGVDARYLLVQGSGKAQRQTPRGAVSLAAKTVPAAKSSDQARTHLATPLQLPALSWKTHDNKEQALDFSAYKGTLVNLWASWCQPCLKELAAFTKGKDQLQAAGLTVLPLSVDGLGDKRSDQASALRTMKRLRFPFQHGLATTELLGKLEIAAQEVYPMNLSLPVPTSLLVDRRGQLVAIYKGPVELDTLLADASKLLKGNTGDYAAAAPLSGRAYTRPGRRAYAKLAQEMLRAGFRDDAMAYLDRMSGMPGGESVKSADVLVNTGISFAKTGEWDKAEAQFRRSLKLNPDQEKAYYNLGLVYKDKKEWDSAEQHLRKALELQPDYTQAWFGLAEVLIGKKDRNGALAAYRKALEFDPFNGRFHNSLAIALAGGGDMDGAVDHFEKSIRYRPDSVRTRFNLSRAYIQQGRVADAVPHLDAALKLQPDMAPARRELIWILAASRNADLRNGTRALELAEAQIKQTRNPLTLQQLAAAQAETGRFDAALATTEEAIRLAGNKDPRIISQLRYTQKRYQNQQPFRHPKY